MGDGVGFVGWGDALVPSSISSILFSSIELTAKNRPRKNKTENEALFTDFPKIQSAQVSKLTRSDRLKWLLKVVRVCILRGCECHLSN